MPVTAPLGLLLTLLGAPAPVDFNRDVRPILSNRCNACHGPDEAARKGKLRLDTRDGALAGEAVVPGKPAESELLRRVLSKDTDEVMPPPHAGRALTEREAQVLEAWIRQGADYAKHWAYAAPKRPPLPAQRGGAFAGWTAPVDRFLADKLHAAGLAPQPEADRATLIRRLSLDLTGLPPTPAEVRAFVGDASPDAYDKLVDRLLNAPGYGEHWARLWLDLARYADSAGYADDPGRTIWPYRDWVIDAFQRNQPFDEFTVDQLAGDLRPNPTEAQLVATAFHRNTLTNNEGGTSDEEFRNVAVVDRVNTTFAVWAGTSMACAQCHTHKYDPITQTEYFRVFALFNSTADADRKDESPTLALAQPLAPRWRRAVLEARVKRLAAARSPDAERAKRELAALAPPTVPVMRELPPGQRRATHLQRRGNYLDLGPAVAPGAPAALGAGGPVADRMALARWLVAPDNPLTARVTVNRFWEALFGAGLVRTSEEFGAQGEGPSHPELLDWLAVEVMTPERGRPWDVKALLKTLVSTAAYRQSSRVTPEALAADPDNRLLSRGARFRLSAEAVRDQALAAGGLLNAKVGGPSVRPAQPKSGLSAAFGGGLDWQASQNGDQHRRGLYTEWRRSNPYPSLAAFDAPARDACTVRRGRTNTPLQALVTLNDPVYVEAAQALGRLMARESSVEAGLAMGFERCLARAPTPPELARLAALHRQTRLRYAFRPKDARALAGEPRGPAYELAAWAVVGNVLLNLDEFLMRR